MEIVSITRKGVEVKFHGRTRGGYKFGIYAANHAGKYPYIGYVLERGQRKTMLWNDNFEVYRNSVADNKYDLVRVADCPYKDFKVDDKVRVRNSTSALWENRYFAKAVNGVAHCYTGGADSWTSGGKTCGWAYCEKVPNNEKLKEADNDKERSFSSRC